ncbi:DUF2239 family protein [Paraburkholderia sp. J41]|uniref:DUF2239 family protein n=1 Tax=Paraburkholderia sp. J41 TaxID=2805433 RepID=UPI002AC33D05|nr:DUF2239 family protein [Paraburkholderia sp. J41]
MTAAPSVTAFAGAQLIARGAPLAVALAVKAHAQRDESASILVFDDRDARPVEFDLRGTKKDIAARYGEPAPQHAADGSAPVGTAREESAQEKSAQEENAQEKSAQEESAPRGRGRPKLGVVAREVTLLPRHWDWLAAQPGGASVVLRRLVDGARHASEARERRRLAQEAAHRFMTALAGNLPDYENALRALYAGERARFETSMAAWPEGVREYARELAADAFE